MGLRSPPHLFLLVFGQMNPGTSRGIPVKLNLLPSTTFASTTLPVPPTAAPFSYSLRPALSPVLWIPPHNGIDLCPQVAILVSHTSVSDPELPTVS